MPEEWASREKLGFPVPVKQWLEDEPFYKEVRKTFEQDWVKEFFDQDAILDILDKTYRKERDDRRKVWTIYTFLVWYKVYFIDNEIPHYIADSNKDKIEA